MTNPSSDIAFTPAVKMFQSRRGSRERYEAAEARGGFRTAITDDLLAFLATVDTAYLATANAEGLPDAQHRGGPKGFIRQVAPDTLGFADFSGNKQYITTGNLSENRKAFLFLMDYANRRRVKLWGEAKVVAHDADLIDSLMPTGYNAKPEQAILFKVTAWDINCRQHIPQKFDAADVAETIQQLQARITELERENAELKRSA